MTKVSFQPGHGKNPADWKLKQFSLRKLDGDECFLMLESCGFHGLEKRLKLGGDSLNHSTGCFQQASTPACMRVLARDFVPDHFSVPDDFKLAFHRNKCCTTASKH